MALVHENSCPCLNTELDLFSLPGTQTSIENGVYVEYNPISSLGDGTPIEFDINGSGQDYLDLNDTQLYVCAKITSDNGTAIPADADVGPVNNTLHSLFSEVEVMVNGTLITSTNNTYSYRAYLETLLSYGTDAKTSQLQSAMYFKDTPGVMDSIVGENAVNSGLVKRAAFFARSSTVEMMGRIHSDIFLQDKYLPNDVSVHLRLVRNKDAFCLTAAADAKFKVNIVTCKLFVRKVRLSPSVALAHAKAFLAGNAKYPLRRVVCKTFTVPTGQLSFSQEKVFTGQIPTRLVLGCVGNQAYNGAYNLNPFNFQNYNLRNVKIFVDGQQQHVKPLKMNYAANQYVFGYMSLFGGTGKLYKDEGLDITLRDYDRGYALYAFDLTPDRATDGTHFNLIKDGNVRVDMTFGTALPHTVNVIVYGEFENVLEIDGSRNVIIDYGK